MVGWSLSPRRPSPVSCRSGAHRRAWTPRRASFLGGRSHLRAGRPGTPMGCQGSRRLSPGARWSSSSRWPSPVASRRSGVGRAGGPGPRGRAGVLGGRVQWPARRYWSPMARRSTRRPSPRACRGSGGPAAGGLGWSPADPEGSPARAQAGGLGERRHSGSPTACGRSSWSLPSAKELLERTAAPARGGEGGRTAWLAAPGGLRGAAGMREEMPEAGARAELLEECGRRPLVASGAQEELPKACSRGASSR